MKTSAEGKSVAGDGNTSSRRRVWRVLGTVAAVLVCTGAMAAGTLFGHLYWNSPFIRNMVNRHGFSMAVGTLTGHTLRDWEPEQVFPGRDAINVLVLGSDHDYDNHDRIIKTSYGRSDSILVAHVDFKNKTINALTIPRDSAVHIPGRRGIHKINAAHSYGGPELAAETVHSVFGIPIDAYVDLDLEGFQHIVNALGGIDVYVEKKLDYDDNWGNLHIHLKPGFQHLNGYQAMGYVRMRHSDSDEMRSKRQHEFLQALREKVKDPRTFWKVPEVIKKINDDLRRNLTDDQLLALVNFARKLPATSIQMATLPSEEGPAYVTIDSQKSAEVIQRMFFPNQQVALNVDAPDPSAVAAMNAPYARGRRHAHTRRMRHRAVRERKSAQAGAKPVIHDLSVEPAPAEPAPVDTPGQTQEPGGEPAPSGGGQ
ncbi:MAG: LCP family protein [Chthonomonadales bacterium]